MPLNILLLFARIVSLDDTRFVMDVTDDVCSITLIGACDITLTDTFYCVGFLMKRLDPVGYALPLSFSAVFVMCNFLFPVYCADWYL